MDYGVNIKLILEGRQQVKELQSDLARLKQQVEAIKKLDVKGTFEDPGRIRELQELRKAGEKIVDTKNREISATKESARQTNNQLLKQIRLNAAVSLFERQLKATFRTGVRDQKQFIGQIEQIEEAFKFFKKGEDLAGIQALGTELGRINEFQRETDRLELGRIKTSEKSKDFLNQINQLRAAGINTLKAENTLEKFNVTAGTNKFQQSKQYEVILNRRLKLLRQELALQKQQAQADKQRISARNQRIGGAISSGLIGGGFPLLFGQGGGAAAGGALGGVAGGLIGGPFGFALSIVGTAIGDALTKAAEFEKSLIKLNARTSDLGAASVITGKDVDRLAKSLGVAKEEAIELFAAFSEFNRVADKESLALIFGDDPGGFDRLAAATSEAKLAETIFAERKRIGNETADQLLDQLRLGDAATVELALAEARLRVAEKQAIKDEERVTLMDRIIAAAATSQMAMDVMDPSVYGKERGEKLAKKFDEDRQERLDAFLKSLKEARDLISKTLSFQPDKKGDREREREAKAAEKLLEASSKRVRELARQEVIVRRTTEFRNKIAELDRVGDRSSAIRQQGELRLFEIEQARQLQIERINPKLEDQARLLEEAGINAKALADADEARAATARRLADIAYQNAENVREATHKASKQNELFEQQQALADGIANTLGTSMMQGFDALIIGAERFDEALRNIVVYTLQEMARQLLKILVIEQAIQAIRGFLSPTTIPFPDHPTHGNVPMQPLPPLPPKALGGAVSSGKPYMVGERGPEMFVPGAQGNIVPNHKMGDSSIVVNVDAGGTQVQGDAPNASKLGEALGAAVRAELMRQKRPGGLLA